MDELSEEDKLTVERARKIQVRYQLRKCLLVLTSSANPAFHVAALRRGSGLHGYRGPTRAPEGRESSAIISFASSLMPPQTIEAFEEILDGKHDHMSENSFYSTWFFRVPKRAACLIDRSQWSAVLTM